MDFQVIVPERFRVAYDQNSGVWRVLDTWHPQISAISDFTQDVPDNSPAVKIISDLEMNAIISKIDSMGWLEKIVRRKLSTIQDAPIMLQGVQDTPAIKKPKKTTKKKPVIKED